jgi:5-methylcytosine-specific restriction protein A
MAIPGASPSEDVEAAVRDFDDGVDHPFDDSTGYDLAIQGRRYPPKAIVGLAPRRVTHGRVQDEPQTLGV